MAERNVFRFSIDEAIGAFQRAIGGRISLVSEEIDRALLGREQFNVQLGRKFVDLLAKHKETFFDDMPLAYKVEDVESLGIDDLLRITSQSPLIRMHSGQKVFTYLEGIRKGRLYVRSLMGIDSVERATFTKPENNHLSLS